MKVADFFCGAGGFSEGFRQAGFEICFAVDKWEPAIDTYKANKPGCKVLNGDIISISNLPEEKFHNTVPNTEIIIGSPPCVAFSNSNKSGKGDKRLGIKLLKAYLRIVARKKFMEGSVLRYWVLENVPNIEKFIKDEYTASDLGLEGDFVLRVKNQTSKVYNAKYFGAPTNRKRFLCGEFPNLTETHTDNNVITLRAVLESLGEPMSGSNALITDCNYPELQINSIDITDHHYICPLQTFEWETAKRLKEDKGYMGHMSFPENLERPARTVMATMTSSSRESMILSTPEGGYRLPTVREVASMMSFPLDYKFYGKSKGIKHTLVGNAVPPKMSFAIAKAIAEDAGLTVPEEYIPIEHDKGIEFFDLNYQDFKPKIEKEKRDVAKFKYHIPYLIIHAFRVELTNYNSQFDAKSFFWNTEIHYRQGKDKARKYQPLVTPDLWNKELQVSIELFISSKVDHLCKSFNEFQRIYCMTSDCRSTQQYYGPYELLESVKIFIRDNLCKDDMKQFIQVSEKLPKFPKVILLGYYIVNRLLDLMK